MSMGEGEGGGGGRTVYTMAGTDPTSKEETPEFYVNSTQMLFGQVKRSLQPYGVAMNNQKYNINQIRYGSIICESKRRLFLHSCLLVTPYWVG